MRKGIIYVLIAVLLLVVPTGLRYLRFHDLDRPERATPPAFDPSEVDQVPTPEAVEFIDEPQTGEGLVLLDQAHRNNFTHDEINYLDGRLAARGVELLPFDGGDLATALRAVNAFVVITPLDAFSMEEIRAVSSFVSRGGRLLLIGDPTRFDVLIDEDSFDFSFTLETDEIPLNSLANEFDIIFNGDYLYNTTENEGNFRNIILKADGLSENDLVDGLEQLVFYSAHSILIGPSGEILAEADENTWSSATDRPGGLALAGVSGDERVLALGDIHFLTEPYYTVHDNSHFIANIADFLAQPARRTFMLSDFPYFYTAPIDLVYLDSPELGPDAFDEIISLQAAFRDVGQDLLLSSESQAGHDALYLGLYNRADDVADIVASTGISLTIEPPILTEAEIREKEAEEEEASDEEPAPEETEIPEDGAAEEEVEAEQPEELVRLVQSELGDVQMSGTALILLDESDGRRRVIVLAASKEGLENTVGRLMDLIPLNADYALADCLLQENMALCPSNVTDEEVEAELITGGAAEVPDEDIDEDIDEEPEEEIPVEEEEEGDLNAAEQGSIGLGEMVVASLEPDERHSWTFSEGPSTIDIFADAEDLDLVLEFYGPNNELLESEDGGFTGDGEELLAVEIPDGADYHIVVYDFFGGEGSYTLEVAAAGEAGEGVGGIFVFADDDGTPLTDGFTSADTIAALLSDEYQVATWTSTIDGPLDAETLSAYELVIWDSGDYRDETGFFGEDTLVIFDYLDGGGHLFITGASPTLLGDAELAQLVDLEIVGEDPVLLDGFDPGEIITLDQAYEAIASDSLAEDSEEGTVVFMLRGPGSAASGNIVGAAVEDGEQKTVILIAPFTAFPADVQEQLLGNIIAWFGLSSS